MGRKLFCELNPTCYKISMKKEIAVRNIKDFFNTDIIAKTRSEDELPNIVKGHSSILARKLNGVDLELQDNKIVNILLACEKINGLIIHPNETFSFWKTVGKTTKENGYKEGLVIAKSGLTKDYGGGLCQMANMIHWLILNSPLEVTELHHHSDALFPDERRRVPFGTGTSVCYNNLDYRFRNNTNQNVQILVWCDDGELCGELRSEKEFPYRYKLIEENHHFRKEGDEYFRISQVYREVIDRSNNEVIRKELILDNHSKVMYDYNLIPKEQIRDDFNEEDVLKKIENIINKNPNKIFYKVNDDTLTYKKLWDSANHYAKLLKKQGTSPVIIYGNKDIFVIVSIVACLIAKRTYVPVGLCTPYDRIKKISELTNSTLIITNENIKINKICICTLDELEKFKDNEEKNINNEIAYMIFTSGSTGEPKGVPISYSNLNNFVSWISNNKILKEYKDCNVFNQASFSFDLSVCDFYYSLCNGHTLVAFDKDINEGYDDIFKCLKLEEINVCVVTPTFIKLCLLNEDFNENNFTNLKCIYFCGEVLENKIAKNLLDRFPNLKIINAYGPTEATCSVSEILITKDIVYSEDILPVGDTNTFATEIEIIDDEIILKGKSVFNGYLGSYIGGHYIENNINCYKTGDIGYIKDGKLYFKGRKDNQIKYKGYRIELFDIENNIKQIKGVKDSVVIAKFNEDNVVKFIKAYVLLADKNIDSEFIKNELFKKIPSYMIPKTITILDEFPINQNGKTDRKAISEL